MEWIKVEEKLPNNNQKCMFVIGSLVNDKKEKIYGKFVNLPEKTEVKENFENGDPLKKIIITTVYSPRKYVEVESQCSDKGCGSYEPIEIPFVKVLAWLPIPNYMNY